MMKLLQIEFKKISTYKVFWVMVTLYALALFFIFFGFPSLVDYISLKSESTEVKLLKNFVYNFPDIWQNLSWVASIRVFIKVFLGFLIVILITNEYAYGTIRQNIINGMSRGDFLSGKVALLIVFGIAATLLIIISGFILGLSLSSNTSFSAITGKLVYLFGYFVEITTYMSFALMLGILLKRTGFAISVLFVYPIIELIIQQKVSDNIAPFLPVNAMNQVLKTPNTSLIQYSSPDMNIDLQTHIASQDVIVCLIYAAIYIGIAYLALKKRDL